ncbi:MAG: hypothetical protein EWM72_00166 [Nitrospira sp.]|nr:MAG: hypothetical protein EWM72_00166 [Nitrospira sp.]
MNLLMGLAIYFGVQNGTFRRKRGRLGPEFDRDVVRNSAQ